MVNGIGGLHHVTAIASDAHKNHDFYTNTLGLRLVKKTVNFDDPYTYHLYYGNEYGTPGTIMTFFPWEHMPKGRPGPGQVSAVGFSVPQQSLEFWEVHLLRSRVLFAEPRERFLVPYLSFEDPDGLLLELYGASANDTRPGWPSAHISTEAAIQGFYSITVNTHRIEPTARVLTEILGYRAEGEENNTFRFRSQGSNSSAGASLVDLVLEESTNQIFVSRSQLGSGSVHHVAFRVENDLVMMDYREKVLSSGLQITEKIDRNYFYSMYFREPGGVLFEIASDNPGFTIDEPLEELGKNLMLPFQYEDIRGKIEYSLTPLF